MIVLAKNINQPGFVNNSQARAGVERIRGQSFSRSAVITELPSKLSTIDEQSSHSRRASQFHFKFAMQDERNRYWKCGEDCCNKLGVPKKPLSSDPAQV
jgi:hypothetical protein